MCDTHVEEWLNTEVTEICTCGTGLTGRKDALEVQKTSGTALCSAITSQVALGKSLTPSYTANSLTGNHGELILQRLKDAHILQ